jgi:putative ABC transport system ATP-binding protein
LLLVDGVSKAYQDAGAETPVLDDVSLRLPRGSTTSLVGVSGTGKSTLLSLIAGLLRPDRGRIVIDGEDLTSLDDVGRARLRARRIGVVLQSGNLIPFLTAAENVELAVRLAARPPAGPPAERRSSVGGPGRRPARVAADLLGELGLSHRLTHLPRRLSGGEAQRVAAAVALANRPDLLLADEVTGELDSASAEQLMGVILDASRDRGLTVLYVTHSRDLADRARHRLRLVGGQVLPA